MSWIPWQSVQVAALLAFDFPRSRACTLWRYSSTCDAWQTAQSTGASFSEWGKSVVRARSWWQSTQDAPAAPCTESPNTFLSTKMEDPFALLADGSSWHVRQSSLAGGFGGAGAAARRGAAVKSNAASTPPSLIRTILLGRGIAGVRPLLELVEVRHAVSVAVHLLERDEVVLAVLALDLVDVGAELVHGGVVLLGHRLRVAGTALDLGIGILLPELLLDVHRGERGARDERGGRDEREHCETRVFHVAFFLQGRHLR